MLFLKSSSPEVPKIKMKCQWHQIIRPQGLTSSSIVIHPLVPIMAFHIFMPNQRTLSYISQTRLASGNVFLASTILLEHYLCFFTNWKITHLSTQALQVSAETKRILKLSYCLQMSTAGIIFVMWNRRKEKPSRNLSNNEKYCSVWHNLIGWNSETL